MKRVHVIIVGRVQGVFFRARMKSMAESLELKGWAKNLPGGCVEAEFEGPDEAVDEVVEWCRKGPALARVDDVIVNEEIYRGQFKDFRIVP